MLSGLLILMLLVPPTPEPPTVPPVLMLAKDRDTVVFKWSPEVRGSLVRSYAPQFQTSTTVCSGLPPCQEPLADKSPLVFYQVLTPSIGTGGAASPLPKG